ncbi:unnamed protein product [Protopolystoma xenopodis]|uniref:Uncharacterized protein n=1 Tax=Protopolystoma xenopodis TaxID=117903 RepID=A0A448WQL8_9PLAT|nr:unnamed protein product [Protopolystoma xenopodis]
MSRLSDDAFESPAGALQAPLDRGIWLGTGSNLNAPQTAQLPDFLASSLHKTSLVGSQNVDTKGSRWTWLDLHAILIESHILVMKIKGSCRPYLWGILLMAWVAANDVGGCYFSQVCIVTVSLQNHMNLNRRYEDQDGVAFCVVVVSFLCIQVV